MSEIIVMTSKEYYDTWRKSGQDADDETEEKFAILISKPSSVIIVMDDYDENNPGNITRLFKTNKTATGLLWNYPAKDSFICCGTRFRIESFLEHLKNHHDSEDVEFFLFHPEIYLTDSYDDSADDL